ncbi:MAG: hypothetical protein ACRD2T_08340 [Thermoanaerobaculia bacterium]
MYSRNPGPGRVAVGSLGLGGPVPRDLLLLLAVLFVTFALQFLAPALVAPLRLTSEAWRRLWLWQPLTYAAVGYGPPSLWFLVELLMLFWFGRDVYVQLGRRRFWRLLAGGALGAAAVALLVDLAASLLTGRTLSLLFPLMQGQRIVLVTVVAAFATLYRDATIYLFFVLPLPARWLLWAELLIAFIGFLQMPAPGLPRDLPGLLGICAAVGITWLTLTRRGTRRGLREPQLRLQRWWLERRLERHRRKSRLRVVREEPGEVRKGPWVR